MEIVKTQVVIIGAGLVGSLTAKVLREAGYDSLILDMEHPYAASKCSFGIWKDGWVNDAIRKEYEAGMSTLEKYAGEREVLELFNMKKEKIDEFYYINPAKVLNEEFLPAEVLSVENNKVKFVMEGQKYMAKATVAVVVCAGAFTQELLENSGYKNAPQMDKLWGATMDVDMEIEESRIMEWAPYKQCILYKTNGKKFVFGDGATVKNPQENDPRVKKASARLQEHLDMVTQIKVPNEKIRSVKQGYRPYLKKGTPKFINKHDKRLFSATGGAKNTTILCGFMAQEVLKQIKKL
jgi:glycine/D-amino acid oxidase-like deaminating enzyme